MTFPVEKEELRDWCLRGDGDFYELEPGVYSDEHELVCESQTFGEVRMNDRGDISVSGIDINSEDLKSATISTHHEDRLGKHTVDEMRIRSDEHDLTIKMNRGDMDVVE